MIETLRRRRLAGQALYALLFLAVLFWRLMPLDPGRVAWPGPDLGLCLTFAWLLRRPDQVAPWLVVALFLTEDLLLMRPPGLWPALVLLGTEAARRREARWRELPFVVEWLRVAVLLGLMMLANRLVLAIFFLPLAPPGQAIMQFVATIAAYPLVVGLLRWPLGLRRGPGEADTGNR